MIAECFIDNEKRRYRVSLLYNPRNGDKQYDMELNCIEEDHKGRSIINVPYAKARELMRLNKIKLII